MRCLKSEGLAYENTENRYPRRTIRPKIDPLVYVRSTQQEAPLPQKAQCVRRAFLVNFMYFDFYRRQQDQQLINHLYETGQETHRIPRNNAK